MVVTLVLVCAVAAAGLALTYALTKEQIVKQKKIDEAKAYSIALPGVSRADDFVPMGRVQARATRKFPDATKVLEGVVGGDSKGYVVVVGPRGYGGPVTMAVGLSPDGKIKGIAIVDAKETQGLGTQALQPGFMRRFKGKNSASPIEVGVDVDAITGATRSSKAVTTGAKEAVTIFADFIRR